MQKKAYKDKRKSNKIFSDNNNYFYTINLINKKIILEEFQKIIQAIIKDFKKQKVKKIEKAINKNLN